MQRSEDPSHLVEQAGSDGRIQERAQGRVDQGGGVVNVGCEGTNLGVAHADPGGAGHCKKGETWNAFSGGCRGCRRR